MESIVNQIDHILIQTKYAKETFSILSETLNLPTAWKIGDFRDTFISGGICFGNINIEILNYAEVLKNQGIVPKKDGIIGMAFEPVNSIERTVALLNKEGIEHGELQPFNDYCDGKLKTFWTNLFFKDLVKDSQMFFCKYHFDITERRKRLSDELKDRKGGLLGIKFVKEIVIGYSEEKTLDIWKKISLKKDTVCYFKQKPMIKLEKAKENSILEVLVNVESIEKAKEQIANFKNIIINDYNELIVLNEETQCLKIRLCE